MRIPRFFCETLPDHGCSFELPPEVHRHAIQVLRLRKGDSVRIFNGKGLEFNALIADIHKKQTYVELGEKLPPLIESPLEITLLQGVSRGERMDYAIQKAVELGVTNIVPVVTERCNVQLRGERGEKKRQHWQGIITSACEQSGRSYLPKLEAIMDFKDALNLDEKGIKLLLEPDAEHAFSALSPHQSVSLLIGPEGGFSEQEIELACAARFTATKFGPRVLRTETASTAAIAVLQSLWGDLK